MSKVVVISSDAMVGEDLETYKTLPSWQKYFRGAPKSPAFPPSIPQSPFRPTPP